MLHGADTTIGRAGTNDVVVDDPTVSRQQAKIKLEGKEYFLYDLATTNPCRVNGKEVKGRRRIAENDRIEMGNAVFVLKMVTGKGTGS
jgi:pSer/pThr/pTyr-binding forkhead associated (FHA) protein